LTAVVPAAARKPQEGRWRIEIRQLASSGTPSETREVGSTDGRRIASMDVTVGGTARKGESIPYLEGDETRTVETGLTVTVASKPEGAVEIGVKDVELLEFVEVSNGGETRPMPRTRSTGIVSTIVPDASGRAVVAAGYRVDRGRPLYRFVTARRL
jgi:hypothetical protein